VVEGLKGTGIAISAPPTATGSHHEGTCGDLGLQAVSVELEILQYTASLVSSRLHEGRQSPNRWPERGIICLEVGTNRLHHSPAVGSEKVRQVNILAALRTDPGQSGEGEHVPESVNQSLRVIVRTLQHQPNSPSLQIIQRLANLELALRIQGALARRLRCIQRADRRPPANPRTGTLKRSPVGCRSVGSDVTSLLPVSIS